MGAIAPAMPTTANRLNIFEPTSLPMAISCSPLRAAITEADSSGSEAPRATMVRPIAKLRTSPARRDAALPVGPATLPRLHGLARSPRAKPASLHSTRIRRLPPMRSRGPVGRPTSSEVSIRRFLSRLSKKRSFQGGATTKIGA